jgi:hypothetical protein
MATQYTAGIVQGQKWTAAIANQIGAAPESYAPTLTQNNTVSATVSYAKYQQINKLVRVEFQLIVTGTGTAGNKITLSLPIAAFNNNTNVFSVVGGANFYDASSTVVYPAFVIMWGTTAVSFVNSSNTVANSTQYVGNSQFTAAITTNDYIAGSFIYEAA